MHVHTCGIRHAELMDGSDRYDVISIRTPGNRTAELLPGWNRVTFVDVADSDYPVTEDTLHTIVQAVLQAQRDGKDLLVHCEMGVSRSVAVAWAVAAVFDLPYHNRFHGNSVLKQRVIGGLRDALGR